jgi:hypothetical protein
MGQASCRGRGKCQDGVKASKQIAIGIRISGTRATQQRSAVSFAKEDAILFVVVFVGLSAYVHDLCSVVWNKRAGLQTAE